MIGTSLALVNMLLAQRETYIWLGTAALLAFALWQLLPSGNLPGVWRRRVIVVCGLAGLSLLWFNVPRLGAMTIDVGFGVVAGLAVISAVATISSRNPVYCAIWFAVSLLATASLMLLQGAQFVGIATLAVYAGAIVVTFLFVLMLAQPAGHSYFDRISWAPTSRFLGALTAALFVVLTAIAIVRPNTQALTNRVTELRELQAVVAAQSPVAKVRAVRYEATTAGTRVELAVSVDRSNGGVRGSSGGNPALLNSLATLQPSVEQWFARRHPDGKIIDVQLALEDIQATHHSAHLGAQLFGQHLIAIQATGTLLLAALVGAVAIAARGEDQQTRGSTR